ncbi:MAG: CBS domain-containing protein [Pirellulales bacterium]
MSELQMTNGHAPTKRPGPFGPAWALLPKGQQPLVLEGSTLASDAIERLVDKGYSQIPVTDKSGRIIGVFSWKSFGKRVADLHATKIKPTELPIREAMEPARSLDRRSTSTPKPTGAISTTSWSAKPTNFTAFSLLRTCSDG